MIDCYRLDDNYNAVPSNLEDFANEDRSNWIIAQEDVWAPDGERYWISTVFLGLNHQFGEGPPLLFETMVFGYHVEDSTDYFGDPVKAGDVDYAEKECRRCSTYDEALKQHAEVKDAWEA